MSKKGKAKKDSGIATLKNGYRIREEVRDALQQHDWSGPRTTPDPTNTELWTREECKEKKFTGFRASSVGQVVELWLLGDVIDSAPLATFTPAVMATMHERAFATNGSLIEIPLPPAGTMEKLQ